MSDLVVPGQVMLVMQAKLVRDKTDMHELMTWWDQHMQNMNKIAGFQGGQRPRAEVEVFDPQINFPGGELAL